MAYVQLGLSASLKLTMMNLKMCKMIRLSLSMACTIYHP
jgi:hypothetical protein